VRSKYDWRFNGFTVTPDAKGYPRIYVGGHMIAVHRFVWEQAHGALPRGFVVHHQDGDVANYALDNLMLLKQSDHMRIHLGWIRENGLWVAKPCSRCGQVLPLERFYVRRGVPTGFCKACHGQDTVAHRKRQDPKAREAIYQRYRKRRKLGIVGT